MPLQISLKHNPYHSTNTKQIPPTKSAIQTIVWSPDSKKAVFNLQNNTGIAYHIETGKELFTFTGSYPTNGWNSVGNYLATQRTKNICTIYRSKGILQHPYFSIKTKKPIKKIIWHPQKNILILIQENSKNLHIWDIDHKFRLLKIRNIAPIKAAVFSPLGNYIIVDDVKNNDNKILWDAEKFSHIGRIQNTAKSPIKEIFFSCNEKIVAIVPQQETDPIEFHAFKKNTTSFLSETLLNTSEIQKKIDGTGTIEHICWLQNDVAIICSLKNNPTTSQYQATALLVRPRFNDCVEELKASNSDPIQIEKFIKTSKNYTDFLLTTAIPGATNKTILYLPEHFQFEQNKGIFSISPDQTKFIRLEDSTKMHIVVTTVTKKTTTHPALYILYKAFKSADLPKITIPKRTLWQKLFGSTNYTAKKPKNFYKEAVQNLNQNFPKEYPIIPIQRSYKKFNVHAE